MSRRRTGHIDGQWSSRPQDGLIRSMPEVAEAVLAAACLTLVVLFGGFLIAAVELLRANQPERVVDLPLWWAPLALLVGVMPGIFAFTWARPRGRRFFPWALLGMALWIVGALLALSRLH